MNEIWIEIAGHKNYFVSNLGRIKSVRLEKEYIKNFRLHNGYYRIRLSDGRKWFSVHQLVAIAFLNHIPNNNGMVIDHINANKTDNRLENLRIVTHRENINLAYDATNKSSKYRGVYFHKPTNKWLSQIGINGKTKYLGLFNSEVEAGQAYKNALADINSAALI